MTKRVSDRYIRGLLQTVQSPSLELDAIMQYWPKVERESNRKRHCLDRMIPKDDPIRVPVDLLAPLNRLSDETLHTRALAYLLDPSNDHGFERVARYARSHRHSDLSAGRKLFTSSGYWQARKRESVLRQSTATKLRAFRTSQLPAQIFGSRLTRLAVLPLSWSKTRSMRVNRTVNYVGTNVKPVNGVSGNRAEWFRS